MGGLWDGVKAPPTASLAGLTLAKEEEHHSLAVQGPRVDTRQPAERGPRSPIAASLWVPGFYPDARILSHSRHGCGDQGTESEASGRQEREACCKDQSHEKALGSLF